MYTDEFYQMNQPQQIDPYKDMEPEQRVMWGCMESVVCLITVMVGLLLCSLLFGSCKTKTVVVEVPEVRTDTVWQSQVRWDSIYVHDSVYVSQWQRGDTISLTTTKWSTKYIEQWRTDTLIEHRVDSVGVPYPVEKIVPAELTAWQQMRLHLGDIMLALILGAIVWCAVKNWKS